MNEWINKNTVRNGNPQVLIKSKDGIYQDLKNELPFLLLTQLQGCQWLNGEPVSFAKRQNSQLSRLSNGDNEDVALINLVLFSAA